MHTSSLREPRDLKQENLMSESAAILSCRFDLALHLASGLHREQRRNGTNIPYISHLMAVCAIVLENGGDEDLAIAALLHDAVEDQGGRPVLATIRQLFGERVAWIV
jgi:(p)ppGpp synthase/HD superfamily hydrolase